MNRNIVLLTCATALGMTGAPVIVLLGGIIGFKLAPDPTWATMPVAVMVTGTAIFTVPAALFMRVVGRRTGFVAASAVTAFASLGGIVAIRDGSFLLFCLVSLCFGANMAFVQQYRFAAAESVDHEHVSRAVSIILLGGIAAAFLGPEIANRARDLLPHGLYSGSFAVVAAVYLVNTLLLMALKEPRAQVDETAGESRPLGKVITQPLYITAVLSAMVAYGVMAFIMTATPVSMNVIDHFSLDQTTWVIQSHILAMFVPSLFTGSLIARFGLFRVMMAGTILMIGCGTVALVDHHFVHYWAGLVLLGIGWNFLFIGGTTLLTSTYRAAERFRAQAINDFLVFGFQAAASLSAGTIIFLGGWEWVNGLTLPVLLVMVAVLVKLRSKIDGEKAASSF
jgi:predicted MFS family arabinose efflux permease